jgi:ABC-2 type transport system permease protein
MRLMSVELTRLRWRRAVIVLLVACVLVPTLIWVGLAWNTRPVSDSDLRDAQQQVERLSQEPSIKRDINR